MIQVKQDGWTFTLNDQKVLVIHGEGITKTHRHNGMTADELVGFAHGWSAHHKMVTSDNPLQEQKYPVYAPM